MNSKTKTKPDWERCLEWLPTCGVISREHLNATVQSVDSFAVYLRDGVLLCLLLNQLKPGAIESKNFSLRPQMSQFLCTKNIKIFLHTCKKTFGLQEEDLFDPNDLFEVKNFGRVIHTLSVLSKSSIALQVARPFAEVGDYYNILPDFNGEMDYNVVGTLDSIYGDGDEEIYTTLISRPMKGPASTPLTKRDMVIKEMVDTEENFIGVLNTIIEKYLTPLKDLLNGKQFKLIFSGIENLLEVHTRLYADLNKASHPSSGLTIADVFINRRRDLLVYGEYSSRLEKALECVTELSTSQPAVQQFILKQNEVTRVRLNDLLYVPIQRVLKYHLLLQVLLKETGPDHPEHAALQKAWAVMEDVSLYINEYKRDSENLQMMSEIQNNITNLKQFMPAGTDFKEYGRRLNDGELKVKIPTDRNFRNRYVFLFDRILLVCKQRGDSYNYESFIILMHVDIQTAADSQIKMNDLSFSLVHRKNPSEYYIFEARDTVAKAEWLKLVNLARDNNRPTGAVTSTHEFHLASFAEPTECHVCRKFLRGVFYQGYLCKNTGQIVHKECIARATCNVQPTVSNDLGLLQIKDGGPNKVVWKALKDYDGNPSPGLGRPALKFSANSTIELLSDPNGAWLKGRYRGLEGHFPKEFGRVLMAQPYEDVVPAIPPRTRKDQPPAPPTRAVPLPNTPPEPAVTQSSSSASEFLENYPWYAGTIGRDVVKEILEGAPLGAFLVRFNPAENHYTLSIKLAPPQPVRYIIVQKDAETGRYTIDKNLKFNTLADLVNYYSEHSLVDSFPNVATMLTVPYQNCPRRAERRVICRCQALYDFSASQPNQLSFSTGDVICVINKSGKYPLWWKGELHDETGYFPSNYVEVI